jgi:hypothetical protein
MRLSLTPYFVVGFKGVLPRTLASLCVLLWVVWSVAVVYGNPTHQWNASHCPQEPENHQGDHGHCFWHCHAIDTKTVIASDRSAVDIPTGYLSSLDQLLPGSILSIIGVVPRGPPPLTRAKAANRESSHC